MIYRLFRNILIYLSSILKYVNSLMHTWASYSNKEIQIHKNLIKLLLVYLLGNSTIISEEATGTFDNFRRSKVKFDLYIRLHIVFCRVIRNILNKLKIYIFSFFTCKTCKKITDWVCLFTSNLQKMHGVKWIIFQESIYNFWLFQKRFGYFLGIRENFVVVKAEYGPAGFAAGAGCSQK